MPKTYVLFLTLIAAASATVSVSVSAAESVPSFSALIRMDGIYRFQAPAELLPKAEYLQGQRIVSPEQETITFSTGEPVAIEFRANGDALIHVVLPEEEIGKVPEAIVVSAEEFEKSLVKMMNTGGLKDLAEKYSGYEEIKVAGRGFNRAGRAHYRNAAGGSYYGCVAAVCRSLGGCSGTVGNGRGMTNYLRGKGWQSVSCASPPVGAVASWTGGSHGLGHTGRWNGRGWCYDLGCGDPGSKYRLRDCVAK